MSAAKAARSSGASFLVPSEYPSERKLFLARKVAVTKLCFLCVIGGSDVDKSVRGSSVGSGTLVVVVVLFQQGRCGTPRKQNAKGSHGGSR